jgi:hypothetical protein
MSHGLGRKHAAFGRDIDFRQKSMGKSGARSGRANLSAGTKWSPERLCWHGSHFVTEETVPVDSFERDSSLYVIYQMPGNVEEWCAPIGMYLTSISAKLILLPTVVNGSSEVEIADVETTGISMRPEARE